MQPVLLTTAILLAGCDACLAQVGRARVTVRAHDQELVDVRQRHRAPSLVASGEMFRELPNMTQLAAHGHFRMAAAPREVIGIRTQQRRCRRPRTSGILPCRQSQTHHVVHAAERVERGARAAEQLRLEVAMPCIPSNEPGTAAKFRSAPCRAPHRRERADRSACGPPDRRCLPERLP